jgi:hypothetical protein
MSKRKGEDLPVSPDDFSPPGVKTRSIRKSGKRQRRIQVAEDSDAEPSSPSVAAFQNPPSSSSSIPTDRQSNNNNNNNNKKDDDDRDDSSDPEDPMEDSNEDDDDDEPESNVAAAVKPSANDSIPVPQSSAPSSSTARPQTTKPVNNGKGKTHDTARRKAPPAASGSPKEAGENVPLSRRLDYRETDTRKESPTTLPTESVLRERDVLENGHDKTTTDDVDAEEHRRNNDHDDVRPHVSVHIRVYQFVTELVAGPTSAPQVETEMDVPVNTDTASAGSRTWMQLPWVWVLLILAWHIICFPLAINPGLVTVSATGNYLTTVYRGILQGPIVSLEQSSEAQAKLAQAVQGLQTVQHQQLARLRTARIALEQAENAFRSQQLAAEENLARLEQSWETEASSLMERLEKEEATARTLNHWIEQVLVEVPDDEEEEEEYVEAVSVPPEIRNVLGPTQDALLDSSFITLWDVPEPVICETPDVSGLAGGLYKEDVEQAISDLITDIVQVDEEMEEMVRKWVENYLDTKAGDAMTTTTTADANIPPLDGVVDADALKKLRAFIDGRMEVERADQTGLIDYASLLNGARIIRVGDRSTSMSLVDQLPVFNRLAALLSLRFYGHGPEAALLPTYPPNALGQCWSFEPPASRRSGPFGVLTVQLSRPIHVQSVSIEHPPPELTDKSQTAIRSFRIEGFEDTQTHGKAHSLGSFEYDGQKGLRQDFDVDRNVPRLQSISLVVDTNWGEPYACLYRFRVHGQE